MPIPGFREDGYLPEGLHRATEAEALFRFGSCTRKRRALALRLRHWLRLIRAVRSRRFFIDGSFVTAKPLPGDLDAVVLLAEDFEQELQRESEEAIELEEILMTRSTGDLFAAEDDADWGGVGGVLRLDARGGRAAQGRSGDRAMITSSVEYEKACQELDRLQTWLEELRRTHPGREKGLTKAGVRKMIARLQEDIGQYEGSREMEEKPSP